MSDQLLIRGVHLASFAPGAEFEQRDAALLVEDGRIAWLGVERDLPRESSCGAGMGRPGRVAHAGLHRLPHASRLGRQPRDRVRTAPRRRDVRRHRACRRRHQRHRARDARGQRRRAARRDAAAPRRAAARRRDHGRDQVGLRARDRRPSALLRAARRLGATGAVDVHDHVPRCARAAARIRRARRRVRRRWSCDDDAARRWPRQGWSTRSTPSARRIGFTRGADARACSRPRSAHRACRSSCTPTSSPIPGGAALAASFGALSADHLEYTSDGRRAQRWHGAGTVAVLLPGAFYNLRETRLPPVEALRRHNVPMAVSTDCNPGTSPFASLRWTMHMACTLFRLTPREALAGVTAQRGARARAGGSRRARGRQARGSRRVARRASARPRVLPGGCAAAASVGRGPNCLRIRARPATRRSCGR